MNKVVLGKGLGALIPTGEQASPIQSKYRSISIDKIAPNPFQPRRDFSEESLRELSASLREHGLMQPIVVTTNGSGYTIVAGERRFRASQLAGFADVPVVVLDDIDNNKMLELALVENIQREDLNPIEVAEAYKTLLDKCGLTQYELAEKVGKSRSGVANLLRLLTLPEKIKGMLRAGQLTEGHARTLLSYSNETEMLIMADRMANGTMTVRQAEQAAPVTKTKKRRLVPTRKMPMIQEIETNLKRLLMTSVKIHPSLKGGRIEIDYYSDEDLTRIIDLMRRIEMGAWDKAGM
jgi:ParB family chromosome partitioning protein